MGRCGVVHSENPMKPFLFNVSYTYIDLIRFSPDKLVITVYHTTLDGYDIFSVIRDYFYLLLPK